MPLSVIMCGELKFCYSCFIFVEIFTKLTPLFKKIDYGRVFEHTCSAIDFKVIRVINS